MPLKRAEVGVDERVAAVRADLDVEGARRGRRAHAGERRRADVDEALADLRDGLARRPQQRARAAHHLVGHRPALEQRLAEELRLTRAAAWRSTVDGGPVGTGSRAVSNSTVVMSTPEMPSTSA